MIFSLPIDPIYHPLLEREPHVFAVYAVTSWLVSKIPGDIIRFQHNKTEFTRMITGTQRFKSYAEAFRALKCERMWPDLRLSELISVLSGLISSREVIAFELEAAPAVLSYD